MLSDRKSATRKSLDRGHGITRFDRTQAASGDLAFNDE
jgi:hypothetical protein